MEYFLYMIGLALVLVMGLIFFNLYRKFQELLKSKESDKSLLLLQNQLNSIDKSFNERMREQNVTLRDQLQKSNETLQKQFGVSTKVLQDINTSSGKIIKEVTEKLSKLQETNSKVVDFAKQMQTLENILRNPKQRGILGEFFLENLLSSCFPPEHYQMQYTFPSDSKIVDAVIFIEDTILPIDAKFSLQMYNEMLAETDLEKKKALEREFKNSVKIRIDETSKYVRPNEKTTEIAMMFIPADGLFYNLLTYQIGGIAVNTQNLIEYAFTKKVVLVSPMTLFAYLQTLMHSIKKAQVSKNIEGIVQRIVKLGKHFKVYNSYMQGLGNSLESTVTKYNTAYTEFKKIDKDVISITEGTAGGEVEVVLLEKPKSHIDQNLLD